MSICTSAASAQRQQILSRISSLKFDSSYKATSPSKTATARSNTLFSPLQYKPVSKRTTVSNSAGADSSVLHVREVDTAEASERTTSIGGVTQKLASIHLHQTTEPTIMPAAFPIPGEIIGKQGARTPAKVSSDRRSNENDPPNTFSDASGGDRSMNAVTHRETKKRRMNVFSMSDGWMLFGCLTPNVPLTNETTVRTTKKNKTAFGDTYDYQLDRLTMNPSDRNKFSPITHTQGEKVNDQVGEEIAFFSPIKSGLENRQTGNDNDEREQNYSREEDTLLTPVEIIFDDDCQELFSWSKTTYEDMDILSANANDHILDEEESPFTALAREFFME